MTAVSLPTDGVAVQIVFVVSGVACHGPPWPVSVASTGLRSIVIGPRSALRCVVAIVSTQSGPPLGVVNIAGLAPSAVDPSKGMFEKIWMPSAPGEQK